MTAAECVSLDGLYAAYRIPEPRFDTLILLCLLNRRWSDLNAALEAAGLPAFHVNDPGGPLLYDYPAVFYFHDRGDGLVEAKPAWEPLVDGLRDVQALLREYLVELAGGEDILPEPEWYRCDRFGMDRLTPCAVTSCCSWVAHVRSHCDGRYSVTEKSFERIATEEGRTVGSVKHAYERAIRYLGALASGVPQRIVGVKPSLKFSPPSSDECAFCHCRPRGLTEVFDGYHVCPACLQARSFPGAVVELRFRIPIKEAFALVTSLHRDFHGQAHAMELNLHQLRVLYAHFGRAEDLLPADAVIFGGTGRRPPPGVLIPLSASFWTSLAHQRVSATVASRVHSLHRECADIVPGILPLRLFP